MDIPQDFNHMLHFLRSRELANTGLSGGTMVSVGASDLGYFHWIDENLGRPDRHIGLEFYRPRPEGLPDNVVWIANTAGNMCDVESGSADLVFAGQTIEHLWAEELAGFFVESARVLKQGGRLVFDSPTRTVVDRIRWNHPEHTVELDPAEARHLAELAGFTVTRCVGHWLCYDNGGYLELTDITSEGEWNAERRVTEGRDRPDESFSWWIEAERSNRRCDVVAVYNYARQLSQDHFPGRVARMMQTRVPDGNHAQAAAGQEAWLVFGPNAPLPPGDWLIRFGLYPYVAELSPGRAEVVECASGRVLAEVHLPSAHGAPWIDVPISLDATQFGVEFRLYSNGAAPLRSTLGVEILRRGIA